MRFTIRDLLWLTVVIALAVGWWMDHRDAAHPREVVRRMKSLGFDSRMLFPEDRRRELPP
jgi:hypothetical protein